MSRVIGSFSDVTQLTTRELDSFLSRYHGDANYFSSKTSKRNYVWKAIRSMNDEEAKRTGRPTKLQLSFNRAGGDMTQKYLHPEKRREAGAKPGQPRQKPKPVDRRELSGRIADSRRAHRVPGQTDYVAPSQSFVNSFHGARNARQPKQSGLVGVRHSRPLGEGRELRNHRGERMDQFSRAPIMQPKPTQISWANRVAAQPKAYPQRSPYHVAPERSTGRTANHIGRNNVLDRLTPPPLSRSKGRRLGGADALRRHAIAAAQVPLPESGPIEITDAPAKPGATKPRNALSSTDQSLPGVREHPNRGYKQTAEHKRARANTLRKKQ